MTSWDHKLNELYEVMGGGLTVSHHLAISGVHWSNTSGNVTYLICKVTKQGQMTKGSCDIMGWRPS